MTGNLKGKVIAILLVAGLILGAVSYFSLHRIISLTQQLEVISQPDEKMEILQDMSIRLNKLNLYLLNPEASTIIDSEFINLIESLKSDAETLAAYFAQDTFYYSILIEIPAILSSINEDFDKLNKLKKQQEQDVDLRFEKVLAEKLSEFSVKDSVVIFERVTQEIIKRKGKDSLVVNFLTEDKRKGLFGKLSKKKAQGVIKRTVDTVPTMFEDTIYATVQDTVVLSASTMEMEDQIGKVISDALDNRYTEQVKLVNRIKEASQNVYLRNARMASEIEEIVLTLRKREQFESDVYLAEVWASSRELILITALVFLFFILLSVGLLYAFLKDLEKNARYQIQLQQNEAAAQHLAEARQHFLATMSHEIRTPLTSIIGYAERMDPSDENVSSVLSSSKHLLQVANEILDMAKMESGVIDIKEEPFNLSELLADIRKEMLPLMVQAGVSEKCSLPVQDYWVSADAYRIRQMLYNLLHNAIKFTTMGYVGWSIKLTSTDFGYNAVFEVFDTGIGIAENEIPYIFDHYKQVGPGKNKLLGAGLGLGIVKKIVEKMDGRIDVKSSVGEGTSFKISLKLKSAQQPEITHTTTKEAFTPHLKGVSVVCVDDDKLIGKLLKLNLEHVGAEVHHFERPTEAITFFQQSSSPIDILITDVRMPEMNGYELVKVLKQQSICPSICIAVSANVFMDQLDETIAHLFDAYLTKPLKMERLINAIASFTQPLNDQPEDVESDHTAGTINLSILKEFCANDTRLLKETLVDIFQSNKQRLSHYAACLQQEELHQAGEIVHQLITSFGLLGVKTNADPKQIESMLLNGHRPEDAGLLLEEWELINHRLWEVIHQVEKD
jgi:signal transduction histidine kinase/DNA-binding response OmpR family regulator